MSGRIGASTVHRAGVVTAGAAAGFVYFTRHPTVAAGTAPTQIGGVSMETDGPCTGWVFHNRGTGTIFINLNGGTATATTTNHLEVPAGEIRTLEAFAATQFSYIRSGADSDLYFSCLSYGM